jgi:hypothetical protein
MKGILLGSGVALGGLITSVLCAVIVVLLDEATGFNIFTFALWLIVPVGAVLCGAVAASGYYLASRLLGRTAQIDTGEVGSFGYWLALFQFIGFLAGAISLYFYLKARPFCELCARYFLVLKRKQDFFAEQGEFAHYYDCEFIDPVDTPEFAARVGELHQADIQPGTVKLVTKVLGCPGCGGQIVQEAVEVFGGSDWKQVTELNRSVRIPEGIDVALVYGGDEPGLMARVA